MIWFVVIAIILEIPNEWNFAVIGDSQNSYHILRNAVQDMNKRELNFVVHVGDLAPCAGKSHWNKAKNFMNRLNTSWKLTVGNHGVLSCRRWVYSSRYKRAWISFWQPRIGKAYWSYQHNGYTFIHLDTSFRRVSKAQVFWFEALVSRSQKVVIFTHRPLPYPKPFKIRRRMKRCWYWCLDPIPYRGWNRRIWKTIDRYKEKVKIIFHGHDHEYLEYKLGGIQVYCTGGGGGRLNHGGYYHYLLVNGKTLQVKVIRISRKRRKSR